MALAIAPSRRPVDRTGAHLLAVAVANVRASKSISHEILQSIVGTGRHER